MGTILKYAPHDVDEKFDGMEKIPPRLLELRTKIHDVSYIDSAINRIAFILSKNLIDNPEELRFNFD